MSYTKLYIFDFCGTIINRKTHLMIKWYCLLYGHFSFFNKYVSKQKGIEYDIVYINKYVDIKRLAAFIFRWSKPTKLLIENRAILKDNQTSIILTAAMDEVVKEILVLNGLLVPNQRIIGSNSCHIIDGNAKRKIVEKLKDKHPSKEVIFFTDSWDDEPVFDLADEVIFSEFLDKKCKSLLTTDNKYSQVT
tara:strand:- start:699 stop:1271 length:573 start_codon:yes stop_codon:yes gene_type:complete